MISNVELPSLHEKQQLVFDALNDPNIRFVVLDAGRRLGKTRVGIVASANVAIPGGAVWWIAPSYGMGMVAWREMKRLVRDVPGAKIREAEKSIFFEKTGTGEGFFQVKSADDPNKLRGEGLDLIVCDEFAHQRRAEALWEESLEPALGEKLGKALFLSTPYGKNFFYTLWTYGQVDKKTGKTNVEGWKSFQFPTSDNPFYPIKEFERAEKQKSEQVFQQEYLAEFNDSAGSVFRSIKNCIDKTITPTPRSSVEYAIGIDWGKDRDFTVFTILDIKRKALIRVDRFNKIKYTFQMGRLEAVCKLYKPKLIIAERNGVGESIIEQLRKDIPYPLVDFWTSLQSKAAIIEDLALAFEGGVISIPDPDVYVNVERMLIEMDAFRGKRTKTGIMSYSAPKHIHDDIVMSLAIAWHGIKQDKPPAEVRVRKNVLYN